MTDIPDRDLLAEFARSESEAAFAELVRRHIALVHSVALRHTDNPQAAQEITQAVFIILVRKAASLGRGMVLSGWLYQTARLTAANFRRAEFRRIRREQEAFMQSTLEQNSSDAAWLELSPLLDDAMARLGTTDRNAVVLRFFENKNLAEVGAALGMEERAAQKRVNRALEKLRKIFAKRGVTLSATLLAGAVSAGSVQAAPIGLAKTISTVAIAKGAAGSSTLALVKGALKIMAWTKAKTAIVISTSILLAAGTAAVVTEKITQAKIPSSLSSTDLSWADDPRYWELDSEAMQKLPPVLILRPTRFPQDGGSVSARYGMLAKNISLGELVDDAYNHTLNRMITSSRTISPPNLPRGGFDLMLTLTNQPSALAEEIKRQFGIIAHLENRERDVLLLKVRTPDAPGLNVSKDNNSSAGSGPGYYKMTGAYMDWLALHLEGRFSMPILNRTELTNRYDVSLRWTTSSGKISSSEFKKLLLDQLGLELVPSREPIEMLVVEKVK